MANPNPYKARIARRRKTRRASAGGSIEDARKAMWAAVEALEDRLATTAEREGDASELTRLTHALSQAVQTFLKAHEVGEMEERMAALEAHVEGLDRV